MERLSELKSIIDSNHIAFLHGRFSFDTFITKRFVEVDLNHALHEILTEMGFERIVLVDYNTRISFLDDRSRALCSPSHVAPSKSSSLNFVAGPLGNLRISSDSRNASPSVIPETNYSQVSDSAMVAHLDQWMKDETVRTAIIISDAETTLTNIFHRTPTETRFNQWLTLPTSNKNICLLSFPCEDLIKRVEAHERITHIDAFDTRLRTRRADFEIPSPTIEEITRLMDLLRIKYEIKYQWKNDAYIRRTLNNNILSINDLKNRIRSELLISSDLVVQILGDDHAGKRGWKDLLDEMVGMEEVKTFIERIANTVTSRSLREKMETDSNWHNPINLKLAFLGNPGTGKTTVAKLMGAALRDVGALVHGTVVETTFKDFVGINEEETGRKTNELIKKAQGGVLFIDEAYQLTEDDQTGLGSMVINTLVPAISDKNLNFCLIFAGYTREMEKFLDSKSNIGLASRIGTSNRLYFKDYTPKQLEEIFYKKLKSKRLEPSDSFKKAISEVLTGMYKARDINRFGNARAVEMLADAVDICYSSDEKALIDPPDTTLTDKHIPKAYRCFLSVAPPSEDEFMSSFDQLVGLKQVKEQSREYLTKLFLNQERKKNNKPASNQSLTMVFIGNPGTGKTTVARMYAELLHKLGLIVQNKTVEIRMSDVISRYVGGTTGKALEKLQESVGGVLFMDEIHELTPSKDASMDYRTDFLSAFMQFIDQYSGKVAIILAGYPSGTREFLESNPGLARRFGTIIEFEDYNDVELLQILRNHCERMQINLPASLDNDILKYFEARRKDIDRIFGNASEAHSLFNALETEMANRFYRSQNKEDIDTFKAEDINNILERLNISQPVYYKHFDLVSQLPNTPTSLSRANLSDAVGLLRVTHSKDASINGYGTGFLVSPNGLMITAYHVVEYGNLFSFRLDNNDTEYEATLLGFDKENDIAVLTLPKRTDYPYLDICEKDYELTRGLDLDSIGYPHGEDFGKEITISSGKISALRDQNRYIQFTNPVTHGNSGGPLTLSENGKVIGIVLEGSIDAHSSMNFARNIHLIYDLFSTKPLLE